MPDTAAAKARLEAQLAELKGRLERLEVDLEEPVSPDTSEQATEMQDDDSLGGQAELVARQIASTERALERIEDDTYGICAHCGAEI